MLYWIPYAFIRISVFFMAGILLGIYFPDAVNVNAVIFLAAFLTIIYFSIFILNRVKRKLIFNPGLVGLFAVMAAGYINLYFEKENNRTDHLSKTAEVKYYKARIDRFGQEKEAFRKEVLEVTEVYNGKTWKPGSGNVLVYFRKTEFPEAFRYGDEFLIKGTPRPVNGPANPGEFDLKKHLGYKNIWHQHFPRSADVLLLGHEPASHLMDVSISMRHWADAQLKAVVHGKREQGIASALVLGITDGLDNELMGAYSATGAMHVLSVSGLHVGILYLLITLLLKPVLLFRNGKWIVAAISLIVLWTYACVTGLSPSVLRAVTMFSFMVVARPLDHRTNIYNVLAASAFCLLLFDPFLIMSVGFQLSYLAVLGIVYLQPLFYNLFEPRARLIDEIWKVTSVSIAAQLATFALGLLYFHQFPNYFLVSNLYVLPLGFVILVGGLLVLAVSFFSPLAAFVGMILEWAIWLLNYLTFLTEALPFSVIGNIHITAAQCIALMCLVAGIVLFIQHRKTWIIYGLAVSVTGFSLSSWLHYRSEVAPPRLSVYKIPGVSAYDLLGNGKGFRFSGAELAEEKLSFHIRPNHIFHEVEIPEDLTSQGFSKPFSFGRITMWQGKSIMQITSKPYHTEQAVDVDYLIISSDAISNLAQIPESISARNIIIDTSNSFRVADLLLKGINGNKNTLVHSVWHQGAFDKTI
jgi:competence protein ComEC